MTEPDRPNISCPSCSKEFQFPGYDVRVSPGKVIVTPLRCPLCSYEYSERDMSRVKKTLLSKREGRPWWKFWA